MIQSAHNKTNLGQFKHHANFLAKLQLLGSQFWVTFQKSGAKTERRPHTRREVSPWPPASKSPALKCVRPADQ
jgi:hypothetical protein